MASATLWFSTASASTGYTDSGGVSAGYFAYQLILAHPVDATISQSSVLTGAAGAIDVLAQNSTKLVYVSEQLAGASPTTANWTFNLWMRESGSTVNSGAAIRIQQLSSGSTYVTNIFNTAKFTTELGTVISANNWTAQTTEITSLTSGQRLGVIVEGTSAGGTKVSGGTIFFTWGAVSTGISGDSWITSPIAFSTYVPPSTQEFLPPTNSFFMMGMGR